MRIPAMDVSQWPLEIIPRVPETTGRLVGGRGIGPVGDGLFGFWLDIVFYISRMGAAG